MAARRYRDYYLDVRKYRRYCMVGGDIEDIIWWMEMYKIL